MSLTKSAAASAAAFSYSKRKNGPAGTVICGSEEEVAAARLEGTESWRVCLIFCEAPRPLPSCFSCRFLMLTVRVLCWPCDENRGIALSFLLRGRCGAGLGTMPCPAAGFGRTHAASPPSPSKSSSSSSSSLSRLLFPRAAICPALLGPPARAATRLLATNVRHTVTTHACTATEAVAKVQGGAIYFKSG